MSLTGGSRGEGLRPQKLLKPATAVTSLGDAEDTGHDRSFPQKNTIVFWPPGNEKTYHKSSGTLSFPCSEAGERPEQFPAAAGGAPASCRASVSPQRLRQSGAASAGRCRARCQEPRPSAAPQSS